MGANPAGQALGRESLGIRIIARPQNGYKYLSISDLAGGGVDNRYRLAGKIDKHFFAGTVLLPHAEIQGLFQTLNVLTELRILISFREPLLILLPQQLQSYALFPELFMDLLHVRKRPYCWFGTFLPAEHCFKRRVIEVLRQGPGQSSLFSFFQVIADCAMGKIATAPYRPFPKA